MQSIMGILNPQQRNLANKFLAKSSEQQAQEIANYCNQNGISKQQLQGLIKQFKR